MTEVMMPWQEEQKKTIEIIMHVTDTWGAFFILHSINTHIAESA